MCSLVQLFVSKKNYTILQILDGIGGFSVVIIEGPTGCGKTTQVPQWILDDSYQKRKPCKIIVTQPRRIAAISIAKRVAQERGWDVGGLVGYQVHLRIYDFANYDFGHKRWPNT